MAFIIEVLKLKYCWKWR